MNTTIARLATGLTLAMAAAVTFAFPGTAQASTVNGPITRDEVLARAQYWADQPSITYTQTGTHVAGPDGGQTYRRDCSGLVSMAWHLNTSLTTDGFLSKAQNGNGMHVIARDDLQPGDAMVRDSDGSGPDGHMELFAFWKNQANHSEGAYVYSFNDEGQTVQNPYHVNNVGKLGFDGWSEITSYTSIRYDNIIADVPAEDDSVAQGSGDVNNDGRSDAVMLYHHGDGAIGLFTSLADSSGGFAPFNIQLTVPGAAVWDWHAFKTLVGDFNGDHRADVAVMYHHSDGSITMHTSLATASGGFGSFSTASLTVPAAAVWDWNAIRLTTGDVNNDGRADAVMLYHHSDGAIGLLTSLADSSGGFAPFNAQLTVPAAAVWDWNAFKTLVADFNGDHRADVAVMYHHSDGSITMHTSLATASGGFGSFSTASLTVPAAAVWDWNAIRLTTGDVNNDGRADAVMLYHHSDGAIGLLTSLADSSGGFAPFNIQLTVPAAAVWDWNAFKTITGDYNGDHRNDLAVMYHHSDGSITMHTSLATASGGFGSFSTASLTVPAAAVWDWNAIRLI